MQNQKKNNVNEGAIPPEAIVEAEKPVISETEQIIRRTNHRLECLRHWFESRNNIDKYTYITSAVGLAIMGSIYDSLSSSLQYTLFGVSFGLFTSLLVVTVEVFDYNSHNISVHLATGHDDKKYNAILKVASWYSRIALHVAIVAGAVCFLIT